MVNSNFAPQDKKPGDLILSADWNAAMSEIKRLEKAKVNREGADTLKGPLTIQEALNVTGDVKILGNRLKSADGFGILETNKKDWLRINPDENYPAIALYKPVAIGSGGLAIGEWGQLPQGVLKVTQSTYLATAGGNVGIGTTTPQRTLEIAGDVAGLSFQTGTGSPNSGVIRFGDNTGWKLHFGRSRDSARGNLNSGTAGVLMTIQDNGNVGIGTNSPKAKLDIDGNAILGYASDITNFGSPLKSGFYQNAGQEIPGDVPDTSHRWTHLITARHSNTANNHQLQISASYSSNDRLFFRKIEAGLQTSNPVWNEVATRGSNTFSGNQIFVNDSGHLQLQRSSSTTGGKKLFLELVQNDSSPPHSTRMQSLYSLSSRL